MKPNHVFVIGSCAFAMLTPVVRAAEPVSDEPVRDVSFFLRRLASLDHLPELEDSHTAMSSTWDRKGGNDDGSDFKRIEGNRNILLDVDGPGCVHRIFVGKLGDEVAGTRIQMFFDGSSEPAIDYAVDTFFAEYHGPLPYPLVFNKTYPGTLFPFPFAKHCRIELVSEQEQKKWGRYWQVTYTRYAPSTAVDTLQWPLSDDEQAEADATCRAWLRTESGPPDTLGMDTHETEHAVEPGRAWTIALNGSGVIRQIRVSLGRPLTPDLLRKLRVQMTWDRDTAPSVDVPFAYLFGEIDESRRSETRFNSLVIGTTTDEAYCCLPMPFARGAEIQFKNESSAVVDRIRVRMRVDYPKKLPANWGRLHATWQTHSAAAVDSPRFGPQQIPVHKVLETAGPGKYVGVLLAVDWPYKTWWGEGDWLIWTDEDGWPPSYHGTGSEEYFNSGWCRFDRKAVSGYIATHPGEAAQYSFHLNDAFAFRKNIRVVVEQTGFKEAREIIGGKHPVWSSTAFWYAPATGTASTKH